MSPSPIWHSCTNPPIFAALSAAQHDAWLADDAQRDRVFAERVRQLLGTKEADRLLAAAIALFGVQPSAPTGWHEPPVSAVFRICPRCGKLKGTPHTQPQRGRIRLAALRDAEWLERQFDRGRSQSAIAQQLGCAVTLVGYWVTKHGLRTGHPSDLAPSGTSDAAAYEQRIRELHTLQYGPGAIAHQLSTDVRTVRQWLVQLGLLSKKNGHVYSNRDWWTKRLVDLGWTTTQCARDAGIRRHQVAYYTAKFGLQQVTVARACKAGVPRQPYTYPELHDPQGLAALLAEHQTYEAVARAIGNGCTAGHVSRYARRLLGTSTRRRNTPHAAQEWWTARLHDGHTTRELATEAGLTIKSTREKLRQLGPRVLAQAYRNDDTAKRLSCRSSNTATQTAL